MSADYIWETFDSLFKSLHGQGRRVEQLEARVADLERRLGERREAAINQPTAAQPFVSEMPAEKAA
ncbi:MAG TPA: hypothetical protein VF507_09720 [Pyrinomonadaceae bacterium]